MAWVIVKLIAAAFGCLDHGRQLPRLGVISRQLRQMRWRLVWHRVASLDCAAVAQGPGLAVFAKRHIGEHAFRHLLSLQFLPALCPGLDLHRDGRFARMLEGAVASHLVPHLNRAQEAHGVYADRHDPPTRPPRREGSSSEVHLRQRPAAENSATRVGVAWHGNRAQGWAVGPVRNLICHAFLPYLVSSADVAHQGLGPVDSDKCPELIGLRLIGAATISATVLSAEPGSRSIKRLKNGVPWCLLSSPSRSTMALSWQPVAPAP